MNNKVPISMEFFPPKTEKGDYRLAQVSKALSTLNPDFFSITFGAGGSTQDKTLSTVLAFQKAGYTTVPHLSCVGSNIENIQYLLDQYRQHKVSRIVALRGDMPSGMEDMGIFHFANELIDYIRAYSQDHFYIEIAAYPEVHPQAISAKEDMDNFQRKVDAGANGAITQYFFNIDSYLYFVDECQQRNITIPIVPGIMPITNYTQLARFSKMCGAQIPRWICKRLENYAEDVEAIRQFGTEFISQLCEKLLAEGAPGLHFYSMNKTEPTRQICRNLGIY